MGKEVMFAVISLLYLAVLLPKYIRMERREGLLVAVWAKLTLSLTFTFIGFFGLFFQEAENSFSLLVAGGLVMAIIGDYYLVFIKTDLGNFIKGILAFSATQILYSTAMVLQQKIYIRDITLTLLVVIVLLVFKQIRRLNLGKAELPLAVYTMLITFMTVKAAFMLFSPILPYHSQLLFSLGAVLFFVSDLFLGLWHYLCNKQIYKTAVDVCYFTGQLLIAFSLWFI